MFVEWASMDHGTADLKLVDATTDMVIDTLKFHSFESIVVGFSGETLGASFGINMPYKEQPTHDIAVDFYNRGYDVYYYDVWQHGGTSSFSGPALFEAINAVSNRKVAEVAIYGWSHGGGATALLANRLELGKGQGIVPNTFEIAATAYIDAVRYDGLQTVNPLPETRRPLQNLRITSCSRLLRTTPWPASKP